MKEQKQMHKTIQGFRRQSEDDKEERLNQEKKRTNDALTDFIQQHYAPIGTTEQKVYKTTAELQYELENIIHVDSSRLAKQLSQAGFKVEYLCGQPYWVMYEKIETY